MQNKADWSEEVRNYFIKRNAEKKLYDLRARYDFRAKLMQKIKLDKYLVSLRSKKPKGVFEELD